MSERRLLDFPELEDFQRDLYRFSALEADGPNACEMGSWGRPMMIQGAPPIRKRAKHRENERLNPINKMIRRLNNSLAQDIYQSLYPVPRFIGLKELVGEAGRTIPVVYGRNKDCECGKEKHGFAAHSEWCPKYERT